jgi:hypothetical protein
MTISLLIYETLRVAYFSVGVHSAQVPNAQYSMPLLSIYLIIDINSQLLKY